MTKIQLKEWQEEGSGLWHAAYTDTFAAGVSNFALVAHGCGMTANEYTKWVIDNFSPDEVYYTKDYSTVFFAWKTQEKVRKYKNTVNKILRDKKLV